MEDDMPSIGRQKARGEDARTFRPVVLDRDDLDRLHELFSGRRLAVARSIYVAFVERISSGDDAFTRRELATAAGVTTKTIDEYVPEFIAGGLIEREHRHADGLNLTNLWRLVSAQGARSVPTGHAACGGNADDPQQPSSPSQGSGEGGSGEAACLPGDELDALADVSAELLADARELLRRKSKVGGRLVTVAEMACAAAAVAEINRQSGSEFGIGAHLPAIVGRVRERPSYDPAAHTRLVQSAWRLKWWERSGAGRRPTPAVIYGNARVFEQVVQDAVDERKGTTRETTEPEKRFTRKDD